MGHYVTSEDSDYFIGYCECNQLPCLSCVAAQRKLEAADRLRGDVVRAYFDHHNKWPQSAYLDAVIEAFRKHGLELKTTCQCGPLRREIVHETSGFYPQTGCLTCNLWDDKPRLLNK